MYDVLRAVLVRFLYHRKPYLALKFEVTDTVGDLIDFVGEDCYLDSEQFSLSLANGQARKQLWQVFPDTSEIILTVVKLEDSQYESPPKLDVADKETSICQMKNI